MPEEGEEIAVITMESGEVFKLRFFPDEAPEKPSTTLKSMP